MKKETISEIEINVCELFLYGKGYVDGGGFKYSEISEMLGVTVKRVGKILAKERKRFLTDPTGRADYWLRRGQEWWFDLYLTHGDLVEETERELSPMTETERVKKEEIRQKHSRIMQNYLIRKEQIERIRNSVCFI